ncbi:hypothetical protein EYF80_045857 [Liparis tanakae]|uniref:Uncharacterized protein n=1 Tax=Liparis tanakae TaxID=230148 RepID=A0A4Z2FT52_9TELE|nr:hypothetical protein EYF80_045857 [Liparis tanakae]
MATIGFGVHVRREKEFVSIDSGAMPRRLSLAEEDIKPSFCFFGVIVQSKAGRRSSSSRRLSGFRWR